MNISSKEVIPSSWDSTVLEAIVEVNPKLDKTQFSDDLDVSFVPMPAVEAESGQVDVTEIKKFTDVRKGYTAFQEKDVLFAKITPCMENGKMAIVPGVKNDLGFGSTEFHVLRSYSGVLPQYVYYYVSSKLFRIEAQHNMTGAVGQRRVPAPWLSGIDIPLPSTKEQHRIVAKIEELFSELDKGIESLKTAREQLKVYRQSLLKHAFEGKLTEQWRKENADKLATADQLLERIKQEREDRYQQQLEAWKATVKQWEAGGKEGKKPTKPKQLPELKSSESDNSVSSSIPSNWIETYIDSFWSLYKKPLTTGPFGTALKKSEHKSKGEPVLGIENIGRGVFARGNKIFVDKVKAKELSSFIVDAGDLIISRSGTVGEICEVPPEYDGALISTNLIRVSLNKKILLSEYFVFLFQGEGVVMKQVRELCTGSSRDFLNQTILKDILFPLPSIEEQKEIINILEQFLSVSDQLDTEIKDNLNRTEALRQSILKKAFSGKLVPQDPNDEPATLLLDRIAAEKADAATRAKKAVVKKIKTRLKSNRVRTNA